MRKALFAATLALLAPALARADEVSVKLAPLEEWGIVIASSGVTSLLAGGILMGMGFDRRLPPGETADEVYIAVGLLAAGAVVTAIGIPLAFMGRAQRREEEKRQQPQKPAAFIAPTFGGASVLVRF